MRRARLSLFLLPLVIGVTAGCRPKEPPTTTRAPQLIAVGEVVDDAGNPVAGAQIEAYRLRIVADGAEIVREYGEDDDSAITGIRTDEKGNFRILDDDFVVAHEWDEDVWVCEDVCTDWETTCTLVDEQICTPVCQDVTYDECWDECWDDCVQTCEDVTTCDDSGCWTDTVCTDDCTTVCEPVCQTVTETQCVDECYWDTHEECSDACVATVQQCGYQTVHHVDPIALSQFESATAEITYRGADGELVTSKGSVLTSGQQPTCPARTTAKATDCQPYELWIQRDRFTQ
ncbi:MAG: hypothetical protein U0414_35070 [Polyangiaceae bacterium]